MRRYWTAACVAVATGFYISYIPVKFFEIAGRWKPLRPLTAGIPKNWTGAGLAGTLEGWAIVYLLPDDTAAFFVVLIAAVFLACWVSGEAEQGLGQKDDPRIVIDEVVGYWVAVALLPRRAAVLAAGFILFRCLDSVKLPPYRWLEKLPGGFGIVMDDVGAGIVANIILRVALTWT